MADLATARDNLRAAINENSIVRGQGPLLSPRALSDLLRVVGDSEHLLDVCIESYRANTAAIINRSNPPAGPLPALDYNTLQPADIQADTDRLSGAHQTASNRFRTALMGNLTERGTMLHPLQLGRILQAVDRLPARDIEEYAGSLNENTAAIRAGRAAVPGYTPPPLPEFGNPERSWSSDISENTQSIQSAHLRRVIRANMEARGLPLNDANQAQVEAAVNTFNNLPSSSFRHSIQAVSQNTAAVTAIRETVPGHIAPALNYNNLRFYPETQENTNQITNLNADFIALRDAITANAAVRGHPLEPQRVSEILNNFSGLNPAQIRSYADTLGENTSVVRNLRNEAPSYAVPALNYTPAEAGEISAHTREVTPLIRLQAAIVDNAAARGLPAVPPEQMTAILNRFNGAGRASAEAYAEALNANTSTYRAITAATPGYTAPALPAHAPQAQAAVAADTQRVEALDALRTAITENAAARRVELTPDQMAAALNHLNGADTALLNNLAQALRSNSSAIILRRESAPDFSPPAVNYSQLQLADIQANTQGMAAPAATTANSQSTPSAPPSDPAPDTSGVTTASPASASASASMPAAVLEAARAARPQANVAQVRQEIFRDWQERGLNSLEDFTRPGSVATARDYFNNYTLRRQVQSGDLALNPAQMPEFNQLVRDHPNDADGNPSYAPLRQGYAVNTVQVAADFGRGPSQATPGGDFRAYFNNREFP